MMKAYKSFDAYQAAQKARHRPIIRALRKFVNRTAPRLVESVKWGNGCWVKGKWPVAYVYSGPAYVQFGFIMGSKLKDPKKLLHGDGAYVRHLKVAGTADIRPRAFAPLLRQAAAYQRKG